MDFINSWKSKRKQGNKWIIKIRLGKLTIFDLYYDYSRHQFGVILFNLGVRTPPPQKHGHGNKNISYEDS